MLFFEIFNAVSCGRNVPLVRRSREHIRFTDAFLFIVWICVYEHGGRILTVFEKSFVTAVFGAREVWFFEKTQRTIRAAFRLESFFQPNDLSSPRHLIITSKWTKWSVRNRRPQHTRGSLTFTIIINIDKVMCMNMSDAAGDLNDQYIITHALCVSITWYRRVFFDTVVRCTVERIFFFLNSFWWTTK